MNGIDAELRSEKNIFSSWESPNKIIVSILCIAYNHQDYIETAILSFLSQETDFAFEVLINDDFSTDSTAEIIRHYQTLYPKIVKPIYQIKNQYSQGKDPIQGLFKIAAGEYIAICDGDDYWCSKWKLARQVNVFRKYSDVSLCFHPAETIDELSKSKDIICRHFSSEQHVSIKAVILGRGHFMPTASLMFINTNIDTLLESYRNAPVGDYFIQVFMSALKGAYYLNEPMCVYRKNTPSSWSANLHFDNDSKIAHKLLMFEPIDNFSTFFKEPDYNKYFEKVLVNYFLGTLKLSTGMKNYAYIFRCLHQAVMKLSHLNKHSIIIQVRFRLLKINIRRFIKKIPWEKIVPTFYPSLFR